jgi:hypothetical protein
MGVDEVVCVTVDEPKAVAELAGTLSLKGSRVSEQQPRPSTLACRQGRHSTC